MLLYLLHYNNYYNRMHKKESNIFSYMDYRVNSNLMTNPITCNFNPNDGVTTKQIINWDGDIPDYIVASETGNEITSRWFVIEAVRKRGQQYELTLQRDLITDYYGNILNAPIFVKKGMLRYDDNMILIPEEGSYNQIKIDQQLLFDITGTPWIIGYIPKDMFKDDDVAKRTISIPATSQEDIQYDMTTVELEALTGGRTTFFPSDQFRIEMMLQNIVNGDQITAGNDYVQTYFDADNNLKTKVISTGGLSRELLTRTNITGTDISNSTRQYVMGELVRRKLSANTLYLDAFYELRSNFGYYDEAKYHEVVDILDGLQNKTVYNQSTGELFRINVSEYISEFNNGTFLEYIENENVDRLVSACSNTLGSYYSETIPVAGRNYQTIYDFTIQSFEPIRFKLFTGVGVQIQLELIKSTSTVSLTFPKASDRVKCIDQPFDIFCIPYYVFSNENYTNRAQYYKPSNNEDARILRIDKNVALNLVQQLPALVGSDAIYDVQIVPYCPLISSQHERFTTINNIPYIKCGPQYGDTEIKQDNTVIGYMCWADLSKLKFSVRANIPEITDPVETKVRVTTDFIRLNSSNFSKFFDFNSIRNRGLTDIYIECTYKPYTPWIKLTPRWNPNGLYSKAGSRNYDPMGLIVSGDMSIAQVTSRWADYELNNKNYLSIFDRNIQQMELNRNLSLMGEGLSRLAGTAAGVVGGGIVGGIPGAIVGGIGGAIAGGGDFATEWLKQSEAIDYTKDQFEYQLGNIKALPQGLARTAAQTTMDSYVPTLEYWSAPIIEREALSNKIKYNGMLVQRVDKLVNFIDQGGFFQGQLIRVEDIIDDTHVINALSNEINLGFYLPERSTE